jgi:hypothetical protein
MLSQYDSLSNNLLQITLYHIQYVHTMYLFRFTGVTVDAMHKEKCRAVSRNELSEGGRPIEVRT